MKITANITRWDLVKLNYHMIFRFKLYALLVLIMFIGTAIPDLQYFSSNYIILIVLSVLGGGAALLAGMVFAQIIIYLPKPFDPKGLGEHIFTINHQGLHERDPTNDRFDQWSEILSIKRLKNYILVRLPNRNYFIRCYHMIPRRAFTTEVEFEEFFTRANQFWKEAAQ